jgi:hypothetical protein
LRAAACPEESWTNIADAPVRQERSDQVGGSVAAAVVDDDQLPIGETLGLDALNGIADGGGAIARRKHDADNWGRKIGTARHAIQELWSGQPPLDPLGALFEVALAPDKTCKLGVYLGKQGLDLPPHDVVAGLIGGFTHRSPQSLLMKRERARMAW